MKNLYPKFVVADPEYIGSGDLWLRTIDTKTARRVGWIYGHVGAIMPEFEVGVLIVAKL